MKAETMKTKGGVMFNKDWRKLSFDARFIMYFIPNINVYVDLHKVYRR
jgi:hypothetical protein